jgi:hypothetical protein
MCYNIVTKEWTKKHMLLKDGSVVRVSRSSQPQSKQASIVVATADGITLSKWVYRDYFEATLALSQWNRSLSPAPVGWIRDAMNNEVNSLGTIFNYA